MDEVRTSSYEVPLLTNSNGGSYGNKADKTRRKTRFIVTLARSLIKFIIWVLFIAWIAIFFITPSSFGSALYDDWVSLTDGTLFGETGSVLLLYNGPLILIAFLAVPYLLLSEHVQEEELQEKRAPGFSLWTFPVLVKGPFGVVSAAELIGILFFVVFVVWATYAYSVVNAALLASLTGFTEEELKVLMLQMTAYCFGFMALTCLAFLFLPITRGSILLRLIDIPFEHATKYHIWLGNLLMFLATLHGIGYMTVWIINGNLPSEIIEWKSDRGANFAGVICYMFGLAIIATTLPPIRRRYFEVFYYTHQLYIFFVIFLALHVGDVYFSRATGGIFLFMIDLFLRIFQSRKTVSVVSTTSFPCGTVKVVLEKPANLHYNALGFIFLRVREISQLQWHPFSVSSSPLDGKNHLSVLIKSVGDWTIKLRGKVSENNGEEEAQSEQITASVEGPYGHEFPYHLTYEKLILIAGGSGISPFLAILSDILHRIRADKPCQPKNVILIWAVKRSDELSLLLSFDTASICPEFSNKINIEIQIYITQESEPPLEEGAVHDKATDHSSAFSVTRGKGMSVLVGTGNKICAGSYVIVTTVGFVLTLGLLRYFYINPFDITYWWYLGLLLLLCMVASVVVFGGLVISLWHLWEKRSGSREEGAENGEKINGSRQQDQDLRPATFTSLTSVSYGHRPDFSETFGSRVASWGLVNVGVIVCGPPSLQSSVAKECRTQNLRRSSKHPIFHFNSHSFDL